MSNTNGKVERRNGRLYLFLIGKETFQVWALANAAVDCLDFIYVYFRHFDFRKLVFAAFGAFRRLHFPNVFEQRA